MWIDGFVLFVIRDGIVVFNDKEVSFSYTPGLLNILIRHRSIFLRRAGNVFASRGAPATNANLIRIDRRARARNHLIMYLYYNIIIALRQPMSTSPCTKFYSFGWMKRFVRYRILRIVYIVMVCYTRAVHRH